MSMKAKRSEQQFPDSGRYNARAIKILKGKTKMTMREDTPVSFSSDTTIIAFRTDDIINNMIEAVATELKLEICYSKIVTDLIAVPAFITIINPQSLTEMKTEEMQGFFSYLEEAEDPKSLCIIFTSDPPFKISKGVAKFVIKTPGTIDEEYLKLKILNKRAAATRHNKQLRNYDRKIFRLLKIKKVLDSEGVLYVEDMCNEFNVSPKTVRRDINLWNALGDIIEYDRNKKGYVLAYSDNRIHENR